MPKFGQRQTGTRAPRVRLGGTVLSLMRLENGHQVRGRLHALSTTGGLLQLDAPLMEGIKVELIFHIGNTTIRGQARMLFPMWATHGCLQPFQFDDLSPEDLRNLELNLQILLQSVLTT